MCESARKLSDEEMKDFYEAFPKMLQKRNQIYNSGMLC